MYASNSPANPGCPCNTSGQSLDATVPNQNCDRWAMLMMKDFKCDCKPLIAMCTYVLHLKLRQIIHSFYLFQSNHCSCQRYYARHY